MENFGTKYRLEISLTIVLLVLTPLFIFASRTMIDQINEKARTVKTKNIDQEINDGFLNNIVDVRDQKSLVDEGVAELQVLLSEEESAKIMLFAELEKLALDAGNSNVDITIQKKLATVRSKTKGETVKEPVVVPAVDEALILSVKLSGTYQDFLRFLHKIENITYFSDVMNITLTSIESDSRVQVVRQIGENPGEESEEDVRGDLIESTVVFAVYLESTLEKNIAAKKAQKERIAEAAGEVGVVTKESVIDPNEQ